MFRIILLFPILIIGLKGFGQIPHYTWRDHFSYNESELVTIGNNKVYCATSTGIFTYNQSNGEIDKLTKVNGLSEVGISAMVYLNSKNILAVGYESGNIDLVYPDKIVNIPDIKEKSLTGTKIINDFLLYQDKIYTSTDFGIVVIDPDKKEVKDTYFLGDGGNNLKINNLTVFNNQFWAATENGLMSASVSDPLLVNYARWSHATNFTNPSNNCIGVTATSDVLFAMESVEASNDVVWRYDGNAWSEIDRPYAEALSINMNSSKVIVTSTAGISFYNTSGVKGITLTGYTCTGSFKPKVTKSIDADRFAVADNDAGLVVGTTSSQLAAKPGGPFNNNCFSVGLSKDRVIVASGGYDATYSNLWHNFIIHDFANEEWNYHADWGGHDAAVVEFNPQNPSSYFVGSWGDGVYQFEDDNLVAHFTPENSTLQTILPNSPFCRISGLAFDGKGNLWVANTAVANPISVRKTDGTWVSFPYSSTINADKTSTLRYSEYGSLWLILPRNNGLFVLNPGSNIDSKDDDKYKKFLPYDRDGNIINVDIYSLAFDKDNYLWLGTSEGVLLSYNPEKVFDGSFYLQKIKIPDVVEGLAVYLLATESVTSVTVDGGNRKWFGTAKSGLYLFNSDGTKELLHFTAENSPLPSNNILDVKIHPTSGEVFIATDKGMVSYRGDANEPSEKFGKVYSYPNPVPPGYSGKITIVGLVEETIVKITDINGNLIYETKSEGGMATWDGNSLRGNKVATGVYLVFCADSKGEQTAVTKILFIK
ncbi:ABC transporter substrate-binding protein [Tenuifilaceae bacterium CYCD]|nr:ABC transporter substrate-binding protein [Tenuifilaceae bacterium CYCD]